MVSRVSKPEEEDDFTQDDTPIPRHKPGKQNEHGDVWPYLPEYPEWVKESRDSDRKPTNQPV